MGMVCLLYIFMVDFYGINVGSMHRSSHGSLLGSNGLHPVVFKKNDWYSKKILSATKTPWWRKKINLTRSFSKPPPQTQKPHPPPSKATNNLRKFVWFNDVGGFLLASKGLHNLFRVWSCELFPFQTPNVLWIFMVWLFGPPNKTLLAPKKDTRNTSPKDGYDWKEDLGFTYMYIYININHKNQRNVRF